MACNLILCVYFVLSVLIAEGHFQSIKYIYFDTKRITVILTVSHSLNGKLHTILGFRFQQRITGYLGALIRIHLDFWQRDDGQLDEG